MALFEAVHRTILVFDIEQSNNPMRTNHDRVVIHEAMYAAVRTALKRLKYYHEDRGDGVLVLVPPTVPKGRLVSNLLARLEAALGMHNAAMERQNASRAAATQVRLRVAVHAGEVTFDGHGVVGAAVDYTFRLAEAAPLKSALATSTGVCALITSRWFFDEVVYHHPEARPELFRRIETEVKATPISAYIRVPGEILLDERLPQEYSPQEHPHREQLPELEIAAQLSGWPEPAATRWLPPSQPSGRGPRWI
jgi:class 3 adenylate cyclase